MLGIQAISPTVIGAQKFLEIIDPAAQTANPAPVASEPG
jgi:hypothetical protein